MYVKKLRGLGVTDILSLLPFGFLVDGSRVLSQLLKVEQIPLEQVKQPMMIYL